MTLCKKNNGENGSSTRGSLIEEDRDDVRATTAR